MQYDYDYIIVGSGFGGAVSALRLSEKGYKVLVIEKGKWYKAKDFPKTNWNLPKWIWLPTFRFFGIMKMSIFRHITIISGTGVGGGSLVYANTLPIPKENFYKSGNWKNLLDWETALKPYYAKALKMLGATKNPKLFDGDLALKSMAKKLNREKHFEHPNVAVFFGEPEKEVEDPYFGGEGPKRSGCNFCGACMTGCRQNAKNTLDKNYLYFAQKNGAKILAEKEVIDVTPIDPKGYEVLIKDSTSYIKRKTKITTKGIVFSGGVLGTIPLLLKLKKKKLTNLSEQLGDHIRTNNETLISVTTLNKGKDVSKGVAIGSFYHADEDSHLEICRYSKGSGFWKLLHLPYSPGNTISKKLFQMFLSIIKNPLSYLKIYLGSWSTKTVVLLFMQTIDSTIKFKRNSLGFMISSISSGKKPSSHIPISNFLTNAYKKEINGKSTSFIMESLTGIPSTAHILGGAVMGDNVNNGVIDKNNKVFGYENMYIIDGSMISANPGVNPSLSITAIAERAMDQIPPKNAINFVNLVSKKGHNTDTRNTRGNATSP